MRGRKLSSALFAVALATALAVPAVAYAYTYPGNNLTVTVGGRTHVLNNYVEPASSRLTAGTTVKCTSGALPASVVQLQASLVSSNGAVLIQSSLQSNHSASQHQYVYCTTTMSGSVTGYSKGKGRFLDGTGSWTYYFYPEASPTASSL